MVSLPIFIRKCSIVEFAPTCVASRGCPFSVNGGRSFTSKMSRTLVFSSTLTSKPFKFRVPSPLFPPKFSIDSHLMREAIRPEPRVSRTAILSVKPRPVAFNKPILLLSAPRYLQKCKGRTPGAIQFGFENQNRPCKEIPLTDAATYLHSPQGPAR
jgi:hypothetical protein